MPGRYLLRLMFEWGGGALWCGNPASIDRFGVGPIEDRLPLSTDMRRRLRALSAWHDGALNWEYPPDPSPWPADERERFDRAARAELTLLLAELGPAFEIVYESL